MCLSPHEMTNERIEQVIKQMQELVGEGGPGTEMWKWRIKQFEAVLKERADNGSYIENGGTSR